MTERKAEQIMELINREVEELSDRDWLEVLDEIESQIRSQTDAKREEQGNE